MTPQTVQEFYEQYGDEVVKFVDYWKYSFTFSGENVSFIVGGAADEIYRFSCSNCPTTVKEVLKNNYICIP